MTFTQAEYAGDGILLRSADDQSGDDVRYPHVALPRNIIPGNMGRSVMGELGGVQRKPVIGFLRLSGVFGLQQLPAHLERFSSGKPHIGG